MKRISVLSKLTVFSIAIVATLAINNVSIKDSETLLSNFTNIAFADGEYRPITEGHLFDCLGWGDPCSSVYQPEQTEQW